MIADARISTALPSHPKTKKLIRRLGEGAGFRLICLFLWAVQNRSDGDLSGMTDEDIELAVDWQGSPGAFVAGLLEVRFLDGEENARSIHDWSEHQPWAVGAEDRAESSRWAALCKRYGRGGAAERMPDYATRMRPACDPHTDGMRNGCAPDAPSPSPSPSPIQDQELLSASQTADPKKPPSKEERLAEVTSQAIAAYNAIMAKPAGLLAAVRVGKGERAKEVGRCVKLAREICEAEYGAPTITPDFWRAYFETCAADDFLSGRGPYTNGHTNWRPDFEHLTKPKTMAKVYERAAGDE